VIVGWPYGESEAYKADVETNYLKTLELAPEFADRVRAAKREARFAGGAVLNFFRKPFGPGWALVGDAGYTKDPITAQGISDAFRDAELCAAALDRSFSGHSGFEEAMAHYQRTRDTRALPIYEFTSQIATMEPPPPEMQQLLGSIAGNPEGMDGFVSSVAGTVSPVEFFAPENIGRLMSFAPHAAA
jgi:flavin-dependent dehydrogenase